MKVCLGGFDVEVRDGNESDAFVIHELWEGQDPYRVHGLTPSPSVVVDIGANVGLFTLLMCALYPFAEVIAFEPEADNYAILCRNLIANDFDPAVMVERLAVYEHNDGVGLSGSHAGLTEVDRNAEPTITSLTLDDALFGIDHVDVLKCDTEGSEFEIFLSASEATMRKVGHLCMEVHDYYGAPRREALLAKLTETHAIEQIDFRPGIGGIWIGTPHAR